MPPIDSNEALPFIVRPAATADDHEALSALRAEAYARHDYLPGVSDRLRNIDEADMRATLLVAEDKEDGAIIGTIRVSSSLRGTTPLPPQMPSSEFAGAPFTYVDRFAARRGPLADVVALALIKAQWFCAYHEGVEWIVAAALPALARRYRMVGLRTLEGGAERGRFQIPHLHAKNYEAVGERLSGMPANLRRAAPFLVPFFLEKDHPDILITKPAGLLEHVARAKAEEEISRSAGHEQRLERRAPAVAVPTPVPVPGPSVRMALPANGPGLSSAPGGRILAGAGPVPGQPRGSAAVH